MNNEINLLIEKIAEYDFKISDFSNKILEAEKEGSEYFSKIDGYKELLDSYISIKISLQEMLDKLL